MRHQCGVNTRVESNRSGLSKKFGEKKLSFKTSLSPSFAETE
jgi:hypothetical protein